MNIELYNQKRDELSTLLQDVVSNLEQIDDKYKELDLSELRNSTDDIATMRKTVYEDIFKIVLVAKFQGGKSTSFNAMTGGSCYSPMGNGSIKCSASPVGAKNVIDQADAGITVTMRTQDELCRLLAVCGYPDVDLNSTEEMAKVRKSWERNFELFRRGDIALNPDEQDLFFVAGFIFAYYNEPIVQEYLNKKSFDIKFSEISSFARFPEDRIGRISREGVGGFKVDEIIYAFVQKVEIRVQSTEMSKIGAYFVDAPGIGVNAYDTSVTKNELSNASAVWYLLGAAQPGADELKAIKECFELCKGRIFFSANIMNNRLARPQWIKQVLPEINQHINNAVGESVEIRPYHALLALLYIQGEDFIANGKWGDDSVKDFLAKTCEKMGVPDSNRLSTEECWKILTRVAISGLYPFGLPEFTMLQNPLSPEGLAIIRRESNWDGTIEAIREFVINTKSKSILITDTSEKALVLIKHLKKLLETREADAQKSFDELNTEYEKSAQTINELKSNITMFIDKPFGDRGGYIDCLMGDDFYDIVFSDTTIDSIAREAAPLIADNSGVCRAIGSYAAQGARIVAANVCDFLGVNHNINTDNAMTVAISEILRNKIIEHIDHRTRCWVQSVLDGSNNTFEANFKEPLQQAFTNVVNTLKEKINGDGLLLNLIPETIKKPYIDLGCVNINFTSVALEASLSQLIKDLIATIVTAIVVWLIPGIGLLAGIIWGIIKVANHLSRKDNIRKQIGEKLQATFNNIRDQIVGKMASEFKNIRQALVSESKQPLKDIIVKFEKCRNIAFEDYKRGQAHRDQVAKKCKEIREGYIEGAQGLEQRIVNYINATEPLCNAEINE